MLNGYRRTTSNYRTITDHIHQRMCKINTRIILMFLFQNINIPRNVCLKFNMKLHAHIKTTFMSLKFKLMKVVLMCLNLKLKLCLLIKYCI